MKPGKVDDPVEGTWSGVTYRGRVIYLYRGGAFVKWDHNHHIATWYRWDQLWLVKPFTRKHSFEECSDTTDCPEHHLSY